MQHVFMAVAGVLLLTLGRRLFWLFVGVTGFAVGLQATQSFLGPQPFWMLWTLGLVCGIIGAVLALFFQQLAVAMGGFMAGGVLVVHAAAMLGIGANGLLVMAGGIIGAIAMVLIFDWTLVILSSLVGAAFVVDAIGRQMPYVPWLFLGIACAGTVFQARLLMASRQRSR
jgi:hypothetical protein